MSDYPYQSLERAWQLLMVLGEDHLARAVAEAKHRLLRYEAQARGEPQVFKVTTDDGISTGDGAG